MSDTKDFYKGLKGDDYIGMRSDCEEFLGDMQKSLYLSDLTIKEDYKRYLKNKLTENVKPAKREVNERTFLFTEEQLKKVLREGVENYLKESSLDDALRHGEVRIPTKTISKNGLPIGRKPNIKKKIINQIYKAIEDAGMRKSQIP